MVVLADPQLAENPPFDLFPHRLPQHVEHRSHDRQPLESIEDALRDLVRIQLRYLVFQVTGNLINPV